VLFTEPTFLFLFLPVLLGLYFLPDVRRIVSPQEPASSFMRRAAAASRC